MDALLSETITASEWCEEIIKKQEKVTYDSLTSPRDLNHIVKAGAQEIVNYLKSEGIAGMKEVNNSKVKEALLILLTYIRKHEVWKPSKAKPLTEEELEEAFKDLYVDRYVRSDRRFNDPEVRGQNYALFSFTPGKDVKPDPDGIYGFIKIRGAFNRLEQAEEKSKELIQYFSANQIFVCEIGTPTPLQSKLSSTEFVTEVDNPNKNQEALKYSDIIKEQSLKEKQQIEEIKRKEEELRKDVQKDPNEKEPMQVYLELRQKLATAAYLYTEHSKKLEEMKELVIKSRKEISDMDVEYPNLKSEYVEHYRKTCSERGIDKATDNMAVMIKKFYTEEIDLPF
jgi:hypothetical protein